MEQDNKFSPLTVNEAAVWGAFLFEGLSSSLLNSAIIDGWGKGFIELIIEMCDYLSFIHEALTPYELEKQDRPGVFEYEVISIFGEYLGSYLLEHGGELPSENKVKEVAQTLVDAFFSQVENPPK